jgi:hypothetical protein
MVARGGAFLGGHMSSIRRSHALVRVSTRGSEGTSETAVLVVDEQPGLPQLLSTERDRVPGTDGDPCPS